jgi:hypothetical protein
VPAGLSGCNIPVMVVNGSNLSNTVTLPISGSGGPCSDSGPTVPTSTLISAAAGQPVRVAEIAIGPGAPGSRSAIREAAMQNLSAALHIKVPPADVDRIMRAYAAHSSRAMRLAMAKYASRWKAVDAATKAKLTAQLGQTQEGVTAAFSNISHEAFMTSIVSGQFPAAGTCVMLPSNVPYGLGSVSDRLDAGTLSMTGPAGSVTLKQTKKGEYYAGFGSSVIGPNVPLGTYAINGSGGADVKQFTASVTIGSHLAIANKSALVNVDRTQPVTVTWTGGVAGKYAMLIGYSPGAFVFNVSIPNKYFACAEDSGKGTFTVPSYILDSMNPTAAGKGLFLLAPNPLGNQITIPGIDLAYFTDGSSDSANVTFK